MDVDRDSPAFEAGVRNGDVITRFGRTAIGRLGDMERALEDVESGDSISVRLIRQELRCSLVSKYRKMTDA